MFTGGSVLNNWFATALHRFPRSRSYAVSGPVDWVQLDLGAVHKPTAVCRQGIGERTSLQPRLEPKSEASLRSITAAYVRLERYLACLTDPPWHLRSIPERQTPPFSWERLSKANDAQIDRKTCKQRKYTKNVRAYSKQSFPSYPACRKPYARRKYRKDVWTSTTLPELDFYRCKISWHYAAQECQKIGPGYRFYVSLSSATSTTLTHKPFLRTSLNVYKHSSFRMACYEYR